MSGSLQMLLGTWLVIATSGGRNVAIQAVQWVSEWVSLLSDFYRFSTLISSIHFAFVFNSPVYSPRNPICLSVGHAYIAETLSNQGVSVRPEGPRTEDGFLETGSTNTTSSVSSPSGVRGKAPENFEFRAFWDLKIASKQYNVAKKVYERL